MALTLRGNGQITSDNYTIDSDGDVTAVNAVVSGTLGVTGNTTFNNDIIANKHLRLYTTDDQANQWYVYNHTDDTLRTNYNGAGGDEIILDTIGRMRVPNQPMFDAYLTNNPVSHPSGVYNMSTGDAWSTRHNIGSYFSSGTFTAPVAGSYLFAAGIATNGATTAMSYFSCEFEVNGSRRYINWHGKGGNTGSYMSNTNSAVIRLAASDYVRLVTEKSNAVTIVGTQAYTHFTGVFLG